MIFKSYLVEENIEILKNNFTLFYGENLGLQDDFKKNITRLEKKNLVLSYSQEQIINDENLFYNELDNQSLFEDKKIFLINNISEKFYILAGNILKRIKTNKVYLFSNQLEKKSKLRNFFEKEKNLNIVPCYPDTELSLMKIIQKNFVGYNGISQNFINLLIDNCSNERAKLKNEITKIKNFFLDKNIDLNKVMLLLNYKDDEDFNIIKDASLNGEKEKTNKLLDSVFINDEKIFLYISTLMYRFAKLEEINEKNTDKYQDYEKIISELKPPVFWKDKPILLKQLRIWNKKKINIALNKTYDTELLLKTNTLINKNVILKKYLTEMCILANAS